MAHWSTSDIPDLSGKVTVVTGGNSGLGYESVAALAAAGATVVMASRNADRAAAAIEEIHRSAPQAEIEAMILDLSSLESIRAFSSALASRFERIDILMNNAGVMALPRTETADGFEMQLGVNHLGHFALTGLLFPNLTSAEGSRVVTVTSLAAEPGRMNFADLMSTDSYSRWGAYRQSKLANMLFGRELHRRLSRSDRAITSVLAHPGVSSTNLAAGMRGGPLGRISKVMFDIVGSSQTDGALSQLRAAVDPTAAGDDYYGPNGKRQMRGAPVRVPFPKSGQNEKAASKLWDVSTELTGVEYPF